MKKYHLISLGCPKNLVDSEKFASIIEYNGYKPTKNPEQAEIIIINTCGFILDAKEESINTILSAAQYKTIGKCKKLIVTGCLVKRYMNELQNEIPEVDNFVPLKDFKTFSNIFYGKYRDERKILTPSHYAYLRISDGCNNRCSYCAIPDIRGQMKSLPIEKLVKEASKLAESNVKELIITAQDTTLYGIDIYKKQMLNELLIKLNEIPKIKRIRLLYLHPAHLKIDMIKTIASLDKVCNYFDIPLQHINDEILKSMNRHINSEKTEFLINKIRELVPDAVIRTTFIVGYPKETEKRYNQLKDFIKRIRFDKLGVFVYSPEEGTPAFLLKNRVSKKTALKRKDELMSIQQEISKEKLMNFIGKTVKVIIDEYDKKQNAFKARTCYDTPEIDGYVLINNIKPKIGQIVKVKIIDSLEYDLLGEAI